MRGVLVKCNIERVRPATDEEWIGAEIIRVLASDAKVSLERQGQRGFVDATGEEGPLPEDDRVSPEAEAQPGSEAAAPTGSGLEAIPEDETLEIPMDAEDSHPVSSAAAVEPVLTLSLIHI